MEVREGMSKVVLTLGPGHTLREAAKRMTDRGVGAAVVTDEETPGPRVVSERDVLNSLGRGEDPDAERVEDGGDAGGGDLRVSCAWTAATGFQRTRGRGA